MIDFSKFKFNDAVITDVRIYPSAVVVDYVDWKEDSHSLTFNESISCAIFSAHGKAISHGEVLDHGEYLDECCEVAEEDSTEKYSVFSFVDVWGGRRILRIVASSVDETSPNID